MPMQLHLGMALPGAARAAVIVRLGLVPVHIVDRRGVGPAEAVRRAVQADPAPARKCAQQRGGGGNVVGGCTEACCGGLIAEA